LVKYGISGIDVNSDRSWRDYEQDEEGAHMLEDFIATGRTYKSHQVASERNTLIEPSCNTNTIEYLATSSHAEEKTKHTR